MELLNHLPVQVLEAEATVTKPPFRRYAEQRFLTKVSSTASRKCCSLGETLTDDKYAFKLPERDCHDSEETSAFVLLRPNP